MSELLQFFRIVDFEKLQHYKDRKPPWIKLYRDLWRDSRFFSMTENQRYQLIGLFVLASQNENLLKVDQQWLRHELATTKPIELNTLVASGWIEIVVQDASKTPAAITTIAKCNQESIVETETETETEREIYIAFGEFGHVRLTESQHAKLTARLNGQARQYIDRLDRWGEDQPVKFAKKKSHYATILNWADLDAKERDMKPSKERIAAIDRPAIEVHDTEHWCTVCETGDHAWSCADDPICSLPKEITCRAFINSRRRS